MPISDIDNRFNFYYVTLNFESSLTD